MDSVYHIPAMRNETLDGLNIRSDGVYVDATFGGGGHSCAILERLGDTGRLLSFDQDMDAYRHAQESMPLTTDKRWQFVHGNFRYLRNFLDYYGVTAIDGILADLGVSFHHFDEAERGFSFRFAGPLDMRMNREGGKTAADVVNTYTEEDLCRVLRMYGELGNARPIARQIVQQRARTPLTRTEELVGCALKQESVRVQDGVVEVPAWAKKDLARLFQALRIEVNDEMGALRELLESACDLLRTGGRIAVLTYHSIEDRMVKNFLRAGNVDGVVVKDFYGNIQTPFRLIEKGRTASPEEVAQNPRARSAKLRVGEKIRPATTTDKQ